MLGLVDYSSSDDSSNASVEHVSASVVEAQAAAARQLDRRDTSGTVVGEAHMLDRQDPLKQSVPSAVRQFHHVQGQWALTAMLIGATPLQAFLQLCGMFSGCCDFELELQDRFVCS